MLRTPIHLPKLDRVGSVGPHTFLQTNLPTLSLSIGSALGVRGNHVLTVAAEQQPDVIVLDVDLPDANGITLGHQLQSQVSTKLIPLAFSSGNYAGRAAALQLGARDFLEKPLELIQLPQRVRAILAAASAT